MTGTYVLLFLFAAVMVRAFWDMQPIVGLVMAMALVVTIESIIHSTYTLTTDGNLVVYRGRFRRTQTIPLTDITDVELKRMHALGRLTAADYVLVHLRTGQHLSLMPLCPEEFMRALVKRLEHREDDEE